MSLSEHCVEGQEGFIFTCMTIVTVNSRGEFLKKLWCCVGGKYVWVIDQACSVKMDGYWPSSFFACLWTETESRSINTQKKNEANIKPS